MSQTVSAGALVTIDPHDQPVLQFDWDATLGVGVTISTSTFTLTPITVTAVAVTSITRAAAVATVTTAAVHGYVTGGYVTVAGATQADYNVNVPLVVTGASTFTYAVANSPTTPATGTITVSAGIGKDNASILGNNRSTQVRLFGGGDVALGVIFELANTIVTNETPAQTKERSIRVLVEQK